MNIKNRRVFRLTGLAVISTTASLAFAQSAIIPASGTSYPAGVVSQPASASQCMGCHGPGGISQNPDWPNLAGQKAEYLASQMNAFHSGARKNGMMQVVTKDLTGEEVKSLANYFSTRPSAASGPGLAKAPPQVATCVACHGARGVSSNPQWPNLAGQKASYLLKQLQAFKSGTRENSVMRGIASTLSDADMKALAHYYSAFDPKDY